MRRSSNPVFSKLAPQPAGVNAYGESGWYQPGATATGPVAAARTDVMTVDDVVVKTVALLGVLGLVGAFAWVLVPDRLTFPAMVGAAITGLILGLVISFARITNPVAIIAYAAVEGVFLAMISKTYQEFLGFDGIVLQAVIGTFAIFGIMALLYTNRVIRATGRFRKIVLGALAGAVVVMIANMVLSMFGVTTGLRSGGALGIGFSIVMIVIGAMTFVLDFDEVERGVAAGLPARTSWLCAFGILLGLVWVYLEVLRLLSYLRGEE